MKQRRRGVTLLELLVVVSLMGILSASVIGRYGRDIFGDFGARGAAHELWMDLQLTRRLAIRSGRNHFLYFDGSPGNWTGYRIVEGTGPSARDDRSVRTFAPEIRVSSTARQIEFTFEGQAAAASVVNLQGPNRAWRIQVASLSGLVTVAEVP